MSVKVEILKNDFIEYPKYETIGSAGLDIRANGEFLHYIYGEVNVKEFLLVPGDRIIVKTGIKVAIPEGYEIQVRPRSGLAFKHGITVLNSPGTIDSDYIGEIGVILINTSNTSFMINKGDRIAQLVLNKVEQIKWIEVLSLENTDRGEGGFNSTGKK